MSGISSLGRQFPATVQDADYVFQKRISLLPWQTLCQNILIQDLTKEYRRRIKKWDSMVLMVRESVGATGVFMHFKKLLTAAITASLFGLMAHTSDAATWHVSPTGDDANDGTSWATAKKTIQAGVNVAASNGVVLVTNGTYVLTGQITVSNAITVRSVNGPEETTVDGNGQVTFQRVFYLNSGCTLDGITVTNGYAFNADGGGVYCVNTNAVITNCTISGNTADIDGGGAYNGTLNHCTISGNTAGDDGGGAYGGTLNNCTISGNTVGDYGGGAYGSTLNNCTISGNTAGCGGGAYGGTLNNCTISANTVDDYGGGANNSILNNCTISGNTAIYLGGGVCGCTLNNCTISGNTSHTGGGAYGGTLNNCMISGNWGGYGGGANNSILNNCTISGNTANDGGGTRAGTLNNCIVYYNGGSDISGGTVKYTCASDTLEEFGNITNAPMFVDPGSGYGTNHAAGNYRLSAGSLCVNAGHNLLAPTNVTPLDLDGNLRIWDGTVDMGAYEYGSVPPIPTNLTASQGTYADSVRLSWTAVFAATDYEIWRHTSDNSGAAGKITNTVATNHHDTTAVPGTVYYYWIKSIDASGTSDFSTVASGWRSVAPEVPIGLSASDGDYTDKVYVTWNAAAGAAGYQIWRHTSDNSGGASVIASSATTAYNDTSATPESVYYYWVKATNAAGASGFSASDSGWRALATPAAPTGVSASDGAFTDKIRITWSATPLATGYRLWRHTVNNSAAAAEIGFTAGTSYDDVSTLENTTYYYWVKATNTTGVSSFSTSDSGWRAVPGSAPAAPTGVSASDGDYTDKVRVTWNASGEASGYRVYRHISNDSNAAFQIGTAASASYDDTTAEPATVFYYWVRATNSVGVSAFSISANGWRSAGTVATPAFNPDGGAHAGSSVNVTITCTTDGATIRYTTDGDEPTTNSTTIASGNSVSVPVPGTLKAKAWKEGMNPSEIKSASYAAAGTVATPAFNPNGGAHPGNAVTVTVSCATAGAVIRYTTNGSDPTETSQTVVSGGTVSAPVPGTFKAKAWKTGLNPSVVKTARYTAAPYAPTAPVNITASDGAFTNKINVTWDAATGATDYRIFRHTSDNPADAHEVGSSATTEYGDLTAMTGMTYYYWVQAVNAAGASAFSASNTGYLGVIGPLVTANNMVGDNVCIRASDPVTIAVEMMNLPTEYLGFNVDWWVAVYVQNGGLWFYFDSAMNLAPFNGNPVNCHPVYMGPLYEVPPQTLVENMFLAAGTYNIWFAVDYPMDGVLNLTPGYHLMDSVTVVVE